MNRKNRTSKTSTNDSIQDTARNILKAFEAGTAPAALAQVLITRADTHDFPALRWSWGNRFALALRGHVDARGYRQWQAVGRQVKQGEKAAYILAPRVRKIEEETEDGQTETRRVTAGFLEVPVFGLAQTEGEPLPDPSAPIVDALPLIDVAREWGIRVSLFEGGRSGALGYTNGRDLIALGVRNLSTWAHELLHVADGKGLPGGLKSGQDPDQEIVAEFGGAVLLRMLGYEEEADLGGCLQYIQSYAKGDGAQAIRRAYQLIERTAAAVCLILTAAEGLRAQAA